MSLIVSDTEEINQYVLCLYESGKSIPLVSDASRLSKFFIFVEHSELYQNQQEFLVEAKF